LINIKDSTVGLAISTDASKDDGIKPAVKSNHFN